MDDELHEEGGEDQEQTQIEEHEEVDQKDIVTFYGNGKVIWKMIVFSFLCLYGREPRGQLA